MNYPPFTDLLALSKDLKRTAKQKGLKGALLQAWRAEACLGDLLQASDCCKQLRAIVDQEGKSHGPAEQTVIKALQTTAVMLYARATSTGGKGAERGSIQLNKKVLTGAQKNDHEALISLRNEALAHVNPTHKVGDRLWHKVSLFAVRNAHGQWTPAAATNETTWHRETLERLERVLPLAIEFVEEKFKTRLKMVEEIMGEAGIDEAIFRRYLFDPVEVFGSEAIVTQILSSRGKASDRFWVNE
ncbi:hypothetical protein [Sphingomicrobium nitratireducens]|uniref:hypothetical protein n=1 Tax=Sphingomicrobium nitratireducens TaxID=2964666 RepID=UPI0022401B59|nr:hypothetical protein [Sphingomicrobium nitratireducens]